MRINLFVSRCTADNSHGRYIMELAKRFVPEHRVNVFAGTFAPEMRRTIECHSLFVQQRPHVARLATTWASSVMASHRWPADIIHNQGADVPVGNVVTAQFCNQSMRKAAVQGLPLHRKFNYAVGAAAERFCMTKESTRAVIAVSEGVKREIHEEYGVELGKVAVIYHGVDLEAFNPTLRQRWRNSVREQFDFEDTDFVIAFVGSEYRRKGLLTLFQALLRTSAPLRVLMVGVKQDSALTSFLRRHDLMSRVRVVPITTEVVKCYSAADCYVLPTLYDTFSMATLEAMACGIPVIVSRIAGISEILADRRDSLILPDPRDAEGLAGHLERLASDRALGEELGYHGRKTAEQYPWDEVARKTLAVYEKTAISG